MEFEDNQYLTYDEYKEIGGDVSVSPAPFNLLEFNARKYIDKYTFGRLINLEEQPQEVKLCTYELITYLNGYNKNMSASSQSGNIVSENIDGYSVTYAGASNAANMVNIVKGKDESIKDIIYTYLANLSLNGTPVLYRG